MTAKKELGPRSASLTYDIRAVLEAICIIMDRENAPPQLFPTDNDAMPSDTDIMRSYPIDTLFDSKYYTGGTKEIETMDALHATDSDQFIAAIRKEVHSLISETRFFSHNCTQWLQSEHGEQARMEDPHDPQVQEKEESQRRAGQAQSSSSGTRRHTPPGHDDQGQRSPPRQLQPHYYAPHIRTLPSTGRHKTAAHSHDGH